MLPILIYACVRFTASFHFVPLNEMPLSTMLIVFIAGGAAVEISK